MTKQEYFYKLGEMVALAQYGIQEPLSQEQRINTNDTLTEENSQNILPAKALGGSTSQGIKQLHQSTMG